MVMISVVMCAYNAENTVAEAIDSILEQSWSEFELIFINDGSTDNTLNIAESYLEQDKRVKVFDQENLGLGLSRNAAIKKCQGQFISFLDADDVWLKQKLEFQMKAVMEDAEIDIVVTETIAYDNLKTKVPILNFEIQYYDDFFERLTKQNFFFQPVTSLIRKRLFDQFAEFTNDHSGQDYYPFLVFALHKAKIIKIKAPLYGERSLPGSLQRSPRSRFLSAVARYKATIRTLGDENNKKHLTPDKIKLLNLASDRFLRWSSHSARFYMTYIESIKYTSFLSFNNKLFYMVELMKSILYPLKIVICKIHRSN